MGTTLEGKQINQTYQGLLKTTDNNEVGSSAKEITDGKGNGTGVTLDNSGNLVANATVTANAFVGDASQLTNVPNDVTSVNSQTGAVTLTTDEIAEGSNEYYTDAKVEANSAVAANTAKVGITTNQANAIIANTAKNSYPTNDASKLAGIEDNADVTDTTNVTSGLVSATSISEDDKAAIRSNIGAGGATAVSSVNSQTGTVVLDTDDISEGTNKYTTAANLTKLGHISVSQAIDLDTIESDVATNNAKVGITTQQANEIAANTLKTGITTQQANDITANNAKVGITTQQANDITANNSKVSMVLGTSAGTALEGDTALLQLGTTSTTALAGDTTTISAQQASDISTNNAKVGITTGQADAIVANTAKVGITTQQASDITANNAKVGITTQQAADIVTNNAKNSYPSTDSTKVGFISITQAVDLDTIESDVATNNAKTGITAQQASDITTNNAKISFDSTSSTKLGTIAEGAEVNVNADWNATSGDAEILNKPTIPTNNNQLTNGAGYITDGNTGWDNSYGFITASSSDTLTNKSGNNSQWTNDAGYINEAAQTIHTNAIGNAIDFSARVTLDGGVAEGTSGIIKNLQNIL